MLKIVPTKGPIDGQQPIAGDPVSDMWITIKISDGVELRFREDRATDALWQLHNWSNRVDEKRRDAARAELDARKLDQDDLALKLLARFDELYQLRNEHYAAAKRRAALHQLMAETGRTFGDLDALTHLGTRLRRARQEAQIREFAASGYTNGQIAKFVGLHIDTVAKIRGHQRKARNAD